MRETVSRNPFAPDPSWMRLWDPRAIAEQMQAQMSRQVEGVFGAGRNTGGSEEPARSAKPTAPEPSAPAATQQEDGGGAARAELDELKNRLQDLERRLGGATD